MAKTDVTSQEVDWFDLKNSKRERFATQQFWRNTFTSDMTSHPYMDVEVFLSSSWSRLSSFFIAGITSLVIIRTLFTSTYNHLKRVKDHSTLDFNIFSWSDDRRSVFQLRIFSRRVTRQCVIGCLIMLITVNSKSFRFCIRLKPTSNGF